MPADLTSERTGRRMRGALQVAGASHVSPDTKSCHPAHCCGRPCSPGSPALRALNLTGWEIKPHFQRGSSRRTGNPNSKAFTKKTEIFSLSPSLSVWVSLICRSYRP